MSRPFKGTSYPLDETAYYTEVRQNLWHVVSQLRWLPFHLFEFREQFYNVYFYSGCSQFNDLSWTALAKVDITILANPLSRIS